MGNVIELKPPNPSAEVVEKLNALLAEAMAGRLTGFMYVGSTHTRKEVGGISGRFRSDLSYATAAAKTGFNNLLGHKACVEAEQMLVTLPRRLRPEVKDESSCSAVSCSNRR